MHDIRGTRRARGSSAPESPSGKSESFSIESNHDCIKERCKIYATLGAADLPSTPDLRQIAGFLVVASGTLRRLTDICMFAE